MSNDTIFRYPGGHPAYYVGKAYRPGEELEDRLDDQDRRHEDFRAKQLKDPLDEMHIRDVFECDSRRVAFYIVDLAVYTLDGVKAFGIEGNYLIPTDNTRPSLYFSEDYVSPRMANEEEYQKRERRIQAGLDILSQSSHRSGASFLRVIAQL